ncbi:hypothetical protein [Psychroflexus sp. MES1-P1E]|uniref:hypothetical protein n=1 Tax=Psychroflexus sp. MES1-P1E TaxID=2058320 RepID=UPI0011AE579B|nr:hypothetical protein [Psychroflexus sp. MES1-P1E]
MKPIPLFEVNNMFHDRMSNLEIPEQGIEQNKDNAWLGILLILALTSTALLITIKNNSDERK